VTLYLPFPSLQRRGVKTGRSHPHDLEKSLKNNHNVPDCHPPSQETTGMPVEECEVEECETPGLLRRIPPEDLSRRMNPAKPNTKVIGRRRVI